MIEIDCDMHVIESHATMSALAPRSDLTALPEFLRTLRDSGRAAAALLAAHYDGRGPGSTVDLLAPFA
jgi:hypothetical protein